MTAISTDADRAAFIEKIVREPDEDTHRLVFADWLEERGEPERAEFIRLQCRVAELDAEAMSAEDCEDARCAICAERRPLTERVRELFDRGTDAGSFLDVAPAAWGPCHWRRGFIERLDGITAADWLAHADAVCWHAGQTVVCGHCVGRRPGSPNAHKMQHPCRLCGGTGLVPRPCPPTAHPIRRVVLTTRPALAMNSKCYLLLAGGSPRVTALENKPESGTPSVADLLAAEWPGVEFELPGITLQVHSLTGTVHVTEELLWDAGLPAVPFPGPGWTVG